MNTSPKIIYGNFIDGSARLFTKYNDSLTPGLLNKYGFVNLFPEYFIGSFNNGLAKVFNGLKFGFIDRNGSVIVDVKYFRGNDFGDGFSITSDQKNTYIIDTSGREKKIFDDILISSQFYNGYAKVASIELNGSVKTEGLINTNGEFVIPMRYKSQISDIEYFYDDDIYSCGLIRFQHDEMFGCTDINGKTIIPFEYDYISKFFNNNAVVRRSDKYSLISKDGDILFNSHYDNIKIIFKDLFLAKRDGVYKFIDIDENQITDYEYEDVGNIEFNMLPVKQEGKWGLVSLNQNLDFNTDCIFDNPPIYIEGIIFFERNGVTGVMNLSKEEMMDESPNELKEFSLN
ncbi:MAG: WG repeat-containing protein [Melioribacteraceae bacterium]|nr:WG repeat-containing protein [Melioribacteraceae bacterium]